MADGREEHGSSDARARHDARDPRGALAASAARAAHGARAPLDAPTASARPARARPSTAQRFFARRSARIGLVLLFALYGTAVLAPLAASDRPLLLVAADERAFERARRTLAPAASELEEVLARPHADDVDVRAAERALRLRLADLRVGLPAQHVALLERFEASLAEAVRASASERTGSGARVGPSERLDPNDRSDPSEREGSSDRADPSERDDAREPSRAGSRDGLGAQEGLGERARALADELVLAQPARGIAGVELEPVVRFPLLRSLAPLDAFLAAAWLAVPLCLAVHFARRKRLASRGFLPVRGPARALALAVGLALVCAGAAAAFGGAPPDVGTKQALAQGSIVPVRVLFPPVPYGFAETHLEESLAPPSWVEGDAPRARADVRPGEPAADSRARHVLGTDALGRDVLARILHGGRLSLAVGFLATALVVSLGVVAGALAGILGGRADFVFLRVVEVVQSFPALLLVLAFVAFVPHASVSPVIAISIAIALVRWTGVARLVRGELLRLRELEFATAARALGLSPLRIAFRHLLPAALAPVLVAAAFASSDAVLTESAISFLGLGNSAPAPSWGGLIAEERDAGVWWLQVFPGLFVFATVVATNLVGEGLREALDPRARGARSTSSSTGSSGAPALPVGGPALARPEERPA